MSVRSVFMTNDECGMMSDESQAVFNSSFVIPRSSLPFRPVEVDRAAEDPLGLAPPVLVEVVDALLLREHRAVVETGGHGRAVQEARAYGDVARMLGLPARRHEDRRLPQAVEIEQGPVEDGRAHSRLAARAQV